MDAEELERLYRERYPADPDPSHPWHALNPVSIAHRHELEWAIRDALVAEAVPLRDLRILDVGCGGGGWLRYFVELGADPEHLHGVDLIEERVARARRCNPGLDVRTADASLGLPFEDSSVDLVSQFVVFSSIPGAAAQEATAREMTRVLRPGGWLLWYDLTVRAPGAIPDGISEQRVRSLFPGVEPSVTRALHHRATSRLATRPTLSAVLGKLPLLSRSNLLLLGRKR